MSRDGEGSGETLDGAMAGISRTVILTCGVRNKSMRLNLGDLPSAIFLDYLAITRYQAHRMVFGKSQRSLISFGVVGLYLILHERNSMILQHVSYEVSRDLRLCCKMMPAGQVYRMALRKTKLKLVPM